MFDTWMFQVRQWVDHLSAYGVSSLPELPYQDWYEDSMSPKEAAQIILSQAL